MHYKNGREAKNGDKVVLLPGYNPPVIGILYDAVAGNDTCNGRLAPISPIDPMPNLAECLHLDDVLAAVELLGKKLPLVLAVLFVALAPSVAFAQDATPSPAKSVLELVLMYVVAPLVPIAFGLLIAALGKLTAFLHAKEKESIGMRVASVLTGAASSVVAELDVTLRPKLEAALADGALTQVEKDQLKAAALDALKSKLPPALLGQAGTIFGPMLDTYLGGLVERAVTDRAAIAAIAEGPQKP